jgi:glycosyltransferase involved in cell wall biosynthesis
MRTPRLSIGLPVYNGARFIAQSLDALLGQSFDDFELIISDNASTDETGDICRKYEKQDPRVRYVRQPCNIGLSPNHNFTLNEARGELFKWASHDDLYARDLLKLCIEALDGHPDVVLAHSWSARIDESSKLIGADEYPLTTASPRPSERFRTTLVDFGGDDDYGVIRTHVLRRVAPRDSYHHADRTIVTELALQGQFYQVPEWLYFRRYHPEQAEFKHVTVRSRCANMDPRRADPLKNPVVRLYGEYILAYITAIQRAQLPSSERLACYRHLARYLTKRTHPEAPGRREGYRGEIPESIDMNSLVAGLDKDH